MNENNVLIDGKEINPAEIVNILRKKRKLTEIISEYLLDKILEEVKLSQEDRAKLLEDFKIENDLINRDSYNEFLDKQYLNEELLLDILERPSKVATYREDRWGPRAQSMYLSKKENYDLIKYNRLQSDNPDVMQEVYFRLKDGEETWENMIKQFKSIDPKNNGIIGPIPLKNVEKELVKSMKESGVNKITRPINIGSSYIIVMLDSMQTKKFDERLREKILKDKFEEWHSSAKTL